MKVRYITRDGYESTAYLDDEDVVDDPAHVYRGEDKYTDEPVAVTFDGDEFREIA